MDDIENALRYFKERKNMMLSDMVQYYEDLATNALESQKTSIKETCTYELYEEEANAYKCSECDELWVLNADTPKDNNMNYCPNCGRKIIHK